MLLYIDIVQLSVYDICTMLHLMGSKTFLSNIEYLYLSLTTLHNVCHGITNIFKTQCCQPSVKNTETSVISLLKLDYSVIRNLVGKNPKPPYF